MATPSNWTMHSIKSQQNYIVKIGVTSFPPPKQHPPMQTGHKQWPPIFLQNGPMQSSTNFQLTVPFGAPMESKCYGHWRLALPNNLAKPSAFSLTASMMQKWGPLNTCAPTSAASSEPSDAWKKHLAVPQHPASISKWPSRALMRPIANVQSMPTLPLTTKFHPLRG